MQPMILAENFAEEPLPLMEYQRYVCIGICQQQKFIFLMTMMKPKKLLI